MAASLSQAIHQIKSHWACHFSDQAINDACRAAGHTWRERMLPPVLTLRLFLLQILYGNTACSHLPRISGKEFTVQAYGAARRTAASRRTGNITRTNRFAVGESGASIRPAGLGIGCFWSMAQRSPRPTCPRYKPSSASLVVKPKVVAFPWSTG